MNVNKKLLIIAILLFVIITGISCQKKNESNARKAARHFSKLETNINVWRAYENKMITRIWSKEIYPDDELSNPFSIEQIKLSIHSSSEIRMTVKITNSNTDTSLVLLKSESFRNYGYIPCCADIFTTFTYKDTTCVIPNVFQYIIPGSSDASHLRRSNGYILVAEQDTITIDLLDGIGDTQRIFGKYSGDKHIAEQIISSLEIIYLPNKNWMEYYKEKYPHYYIQPACVIRTGEKTTYKVRSFSNSVNRGKEHPSRRRGWFGYSLKNSK
jgi:uncharacterized protein (UPF0333 family)